MKTKPKRLLSGVLATMLLGQSLLCNNAIFAAFTAKAETPTRMTSNLDVSDLNISGYIDLEDGRTKEISVIVFDDNWNTIAETKVLSGEHFSVSAAGVRNYSSTTHVKIECNGYLPRFYKDMGFGSYQLGTSENPETLYFGDTTYNPDANNQWSDEVINYADLTFVSKQVGKIKGDENYNEFYDFNHDGIINNDDIAIVAQYDGAVYENGYLYTSDTKESYYIYPEDILIYDLNQDNRIDSNDQQVICDLYPYESLKGDEDFDQFAYMDIDDNGAITGDDYNYFQTYINLHNGCNPYNDYIYNLTLTGDSYHDSAMYLENTNLDLANYKLVVNGNFVFRTQNPYHSMWNSNPGVTLNVNAGTLFIADQFDFGQANSYDKIVMTNDNGKLYVNGIWNYITLADMEGLWTKGTIYFFGSTWQVNEASGDKSIYSTGTHSICFYYQYGQQIIRWANTQDCIYNEETGEYNTHRRFNFDYKDSNGNCLGLTFPCGYSDDRYYFRASLPEEITLSEGTAIPYEDWEILPDNDDNTIPDVIDDQINSGVYDYIPDEWITDEYGNSAEEFIEDEHPNNDENKEALANTLEYTYSNYEEPVADKIIAYLGKSLNQIVLGNYTDDVTLLGTAGQIVLGIFDLDLICDLRDLSYDLNEFGEIIFGDEELTWSFAGQFFFDVVGLFPIIGTLKNADEATLLAKKAPDLYNKAISDTVTECFENGKALTKEGEIIKSTEKNLDNYCESLLKAAKAIIEDEKFLRQQPIEYGKFFNKNGEALTDFIKGEVDSVNVLDFKKIAKDSIYTHNHPSGGYFSGDDIATAIDFDMFQIRAVTPQGKTFIMERGAEGWKISSNEFGWIVSDVQKEFKESSEMQKLYKENAELFAKTYWNEIAKRIGGIYTEI